MKRTFSKFFAATLLAGAGTVALLACPLVYVVNFSGQFGLLDVGTGVFTPVGPGLANTPTGIAGAPGGPFYTVDGVTGHLLRINRDGTNTDVGDTRTGSNNGPTGLSLIGSLLDGTMYGIDFSNRLYRINTNTGVTQALQVLSLPPQEQQYDGNMLTSLTGDASYLYYTLEIVDGQRKLPPTIFTIDPVKQQVINSKPMSKVVTQAIGSGMINGVLYLFGGLGQVYRADPATGTASVVSKYDAGNIPDGPPLTGIFGAVNNAEPGPSKAPEITVAPEAPLRHTEWMPRHWPRLPKQ